MQRDCPEQSVKRCYDCNGDHLVRDCPERRRRDDDDGRKCYNCGATGHLQRDCPESRDREDGYGGGRRGGGGGERACYK